MTGSEGLASSPRRAGCGRADAAALYETRPGDVVREPGIPSAPGLHRVDWDLRHALPDADGDPDLPLTVEDYRELPIQVGNPTTISNDSSRCAGKRRSRRYRPSILKAERPTTGDSPTPPPKITDSPPTHLRSSAS